MAGTLITVADFVAEARSLLQDLVAPYRYSDADLVRAINIAFAEISRVRPDIIVVSSYEGATTARGTLSTPSVPAFTSADQTQTVPIPNQYRMPLVEFIVGYAQLRDAEDVQDARASQFLNKFLATLLTVMA